MTKPKITMTKQQLKIITALRKTLNVALPNGFGLWTPQMQIVWLQDNQPK